MQKYCFVDKHYVRTIKETINERINNNRHTPAVAILKDSVFLKNFWVRHSNKSIYIVLKKITWTINYVGGDLYDIIRSSRQRNRLSRFLYIMENIVIVPQNSRSPRRRLFYLNVMFLVIQYEIVEPVYVYHM